MVFREFFTKHHPTYLYIYYDNVTSCRSSGTVILITIAMVIANLCNIYFLFC